MNAYVQPYLLQQCIWLADAAVESLIDEVHLTPKPALVDQRGSGAHDDLSLELMVQSAHSLRPMFIEMAQAAYQHHACLQTLREAIGAIGRAGEAAMLLTTKGVNTHRGAIWALGLLITSAALSLRNRIVCSAEKICQQAGKIACLEDVYIPEQRLSHGQQMQKRLGAKGAKAQAQEGFPAILQQGLPQLYYSRQRNKHEEAARIDALLAMMTVLDDTCVLYRAGQTGLLRMQKGSQHVLNCGGYATAAGRRAFSILEKDLMQLRASAGGAADLLAATLFLDRIQQHHKEEM